MPRKKKTPSTPQERSLQAQINAHRLWAQVDDPAAFTAPARREFDKRFEREVDPEGTLPPDERARRAAHARKAYFLRLALLSAQSRRATRDTQRAGAA